MADAEPMTVSVDVDLDLDMNRSLAQALRKAADDLDPPPPDQDRDNQVTVLSYTGEVLDRFDEPLPRAWFARDDAQPDPAAVPENVMPLDNEPVDHEFRVPAPTELPDDAMADVKPIQLGG